MEDNNKAYPILLHWHQKAFHFLLLCYGYEDIHSRHHLDVEVIPMSQLDSSVRSWIIALDLQAVYWINVIKLARSNCLMQTHSYHNMAQDEVAESANHQAASVSAFKYHCLTHQTQPPSYGFCRSYFTSLPLKYVQTLASMENNENCVKLIMIGPAQWFKGNITLFLKNVTGLHNSKKR